MARRWRYRAYYPRERWAVRSEASASERARQVILREFFDLDGPTLARVIQLYGSEYKKGARKYLEATFDRWRTEEVKPRRSTQDRILHCVPRFLPPDKQFSILALYIPEYMSQLLAASKVQTLTIDALPQAFGDAAKKCRESEPHLDWFVRGVFSDQEIAAFADVARFTILDRLHRSYAAVVLDLVTAARCLAEVDAKISLRYRMDAIGRIIDLNGLLPALPASAFDLPPVPALVNRHREHYERLLLDHQCEMLVEDEAGLARHHVAQLDLAVFQRAISSVSRADSIESTFHVRGAGGTFEGSISRKNLLSLKGQLLGRISVASLSTLGLMAGVGAMFLSEDLQGIAACATLGALAAIPGLWSWVMEKHREVRDYERGHSARFAEVRR